MAINWIANWTVLAASVEIGVGDDSASASIFCLKEDIDKTLPILADLLQHPAFPQDKIELAKIEQRDAIARRNDDPQGIAFREYGRVIYGKDTPYGRMMENATVNAITREDLVAFHKQYFRPEAVVLGAWGDFSAACHARQNRAGLRRLGARPAVAMARCAGGGRCGEITLGPVSDQQGRRQPEHGLPGPPGHAPGRHRLLPR